ncbi:MAG: hypothetical protein PVF46_05870, partial [Lysobacterales bacterium]
CRSVSNAPGFCRWYPASYGWSHHADTSQLSYTVQRVWEARHRQGRNSITWTVWFDGLYLRE